MPAPSQEINRCGPFTWRVWGFDFPIWFWTFPILNFPWSLLFLWFYLLHDLPTKSLVLSNKITKILKSEDNIKRKFPNQYMHIKHIDVWFDEWCKISFLWRVTFTWVDSCIAAYKTLKSLKKNNGSLIFLSLKFVWFYDCLNIVSFKCFFVVNVYK